MHNKMAIETLPKQNERKSTHLERKREGKKRGEEQHPTKRQHPSPQKHKLGLQKSNLGPKPTQTEDGNLIVQNQQELLLCKEMIYCYLEYKSWPFEFVLF